MLKPHASAWGQSTTRQKEPRSPNGDCVTSLNKDNLMENTERHRAVLYFLDCPAVTARSIRLNLLDLHRNRNFRLNGIKANS